MEFWIASPSGYELADVTVDRIRNLGGVVEQTTEPFDAVEQADAVYTDVWTSMGQEVERDARASAFARYQVDDALMKAARPDAVFLHCLPAHRGEEVSATVIDGPQSLVWPQATNRMHSIRAAIALLLGGID